MQAGKYLGELLATPDLGGQCVQAGQNMGFTDGGKAVVYSANSDSRVVVSFDHGNNSELNVRAYTSLNPARSPDVEFLMRSERKVDQLIWRTYASDKVVSHALQGYPVLKSGTFETPYEENPLLKPTEYSPLLVPLADVDPKR